MAQAPLLVTKSIGEFKLFARYHKIKLHEGHELEILTCKKGN
jgi:hypothetical protein